ERSHDSTARRPVPDPHSAERVVRQAADGKGRQDFRRAHDRRAGTVLGELAVPDHRAQLKWRLLGYSAARPLASRVAEPPSSRVAAVPSLSPLQCDLPYHRPPAAPSQQSGTGSHFHGTWTALVLPFSWWMTSPRCVRCSRCASRTGVTMCERRPTSPKRSVSSTVRRPTSCSATSSFPAVQGSIC